MYYFHKWGRKEKVVSRYLFKFFVLTVGLELFRYGAQVLKPEHEVAYLG